jgi:hypothetical protein
MDSQLLWTYGSCTIDVLLSLSKGIIGTSFKWQSRKKEPEVWSLVFHNGTKKGLQELHDETKMKWYLFLYWQFLINSFLHKHLLINSLAQFKQCKWLSFYWHLSKNASLQHKNGPTFTNTFKSDIKCWNLENSTWWTCRRLKVGCFNKNEITVEWEMKNCHHWKFGVF